ncbi:Hypothetical protein NTJ_14104 [Nesidiocoris tenuis]|uniref:Uncharacterized protein n=1 Tax=Nesidiocoris tenuis TaxID=355587 RepID=A0ABN7BEL6_9HEMI|nr:Hypothetical protein NTJ_14104 [Nesidiocoris tenuis]
MPTGVPNRCHAVGVVGVALATYERFILAQEPATGPFTCRRTDPTDVEIIRLRCEPESLSGSMHRTSCWNSPKVIRCSRSSTPTAGYTTA